MFIKHWRYQKLEAEKLHYITEWNHEDGIIGEHFFEYSQYGDMIKFCIDNHISFEEIQLPLIEEAHPSEYFMGKYKLSEVDFSCRVKMYDEDEQGTLYKSQYKITLEMIEEIPAEGLGHIIKELHENLKQFIYEKNK